MRIRATHLALLFSLNVAQADAAEDAWSFFDDFSGRVDVRAVAVDGERSWLKGSFCQIKGTVAPGGLRGNE